MFATGGTAGVHAEGAEGIQGVTTSLSGGVGVHGTGGVSGIGVLGQTFGSASTGVKADAAAGGTALQVNARRYSAGAAS